MSDTRLPTDIAVVTGDVTMDWNLARGPRSQAGVSAWSYVACARAYWQRGGAALLADLIEAVAAELSRRGLADFEVRQTGASRWQVDPGDEGYRHSYALWAQFPYDKRSPGEAPSWRVDEFMGHDHCPTTQAGQALDWQRVVDDSPEAGLVVLDDAGLGFRDTPELWPQAIQGGGHQPWVLVKMGLPVARGGLWDAIQRGFADRLVVLMSVDDLRYSEVQISRELSWERTAQDIFWELVYNPQVKSLSRCAYVVVSFGPAGAFLLSRTHAMDAATADRNPLSGFLFFDPKVIEGMWEQSYPGGMVGYHTCLAAALARQLMLSPDQPDIHQGIQSGLAAMRVLHNEGYGVRGKAAQHAQLSFPINKVIEVLSSDKSPFAVTAVQDPVSTLARPANVGEKILHGGFWSILEDSYRDNLEQVAEQIVREGVEVALRGVPLGQFGHLITVDRQEIESFRSIRNLVDEYCSSSQQKRPLSMAVFGPPGSGKSFGITQVAKSLLPDQIQVLEFNLSQFRSLENLLDALHQVRDVGLGGQIPLVFWDEFDSPLDGRPLGWLRYFLAPMQDGVFQEGQLSHPIGRSIFVFAGGTSVRMQDFSKGLAHNDFRAVKGPDFMSRLKGYVDIKGPNRQRVELDEDDVSDPYFVIRRAILLRSILKRIAGQLFEKVESKEVLHIDQGVLRAFLQTDEYKHGARSMEAIVAMSQLAGKTKYERSCLPPEAQLDLHADGQEFLSLVQQIELSNETLDKLAILFHKYFCAQLEKQGYVYGEETDDKAKTHSSLKDFYDLPDDEQEQNRDTVRHIHDKLTASGYIMVPARSNEQPFEFPGTFLDELAKMEHERWMAMKLAAGWKLAPKTVKSKKLHADLVSWEELEKRSDTTAQDKDRDFVRAIPGILAKAGYTVVKLRPMKAEH